MKIQKADPAARRKSLRIAGFAGLGLLALLVGGLVLGLDTREFPGAIAGYLVAAPRRGMIVISIGVAPIALFAIYLFVFGARVIRARRFPLPGQAVTRDTPIREGRAAIARARLLQTLAALLLLAALALPVIFARLLSLLAT